MTPRVALNAGHGADTFDERGAKGLYYTENGERRKFEEHDDFNAHVAQLMAKRLKEHGIEVMLPQNPWGKEVPLQKRTREANEWGADVYWSIHANYNSNTNASGACGWAWHSAEGSKSLAKAWAANMEKEGYNLHGSGLHLADTDPQTWEPALWELYKTNMTAVIAEHAFFSNAEERREMLNHGHRERMAEVGVKTLAEYFGIRYKPKKEEPKKQEKKVATSKDYAGHPHEGAIELVKELGILNGYSDTEFRPDEPLTNARFAAAVKNMKERGLI